MKLTQRQMLESRIEHERQALETIPPYCAADRLSIESELEELEEKLAALSQESETGKLVPMQIYMDEHTKEMADSLFCTLGIDTATAIKMFIATAIANDGIPFPVQRPKAMEANHPGHESFVAAEVAGSTVGH